MVGKLILAVSLAVGGWFGAGVAHAEYIQNLGTYAGDVVKQLQGLGIQRHAQRPRSGHRLYG